MLSYEISSEDINRIWDALSHTEKFFNKHRGLNQDDAKSPDEVAEMVALAQNVLAKNGLLYTSYKKSRVK